MKTLKSLKSLFGPMAAAFFLSAVLISCDENPPIVQQQDILPESFGVDIPASISNPDLVNGRIGGRVKEDLSGDDIYNHLGLFISLGEGASHFVESIFEGIRQLNIESIQTLTFESDEDGRAKNLVVTENEEFDRVVYEHLLTLTDADSEGNEDGGFAMQVFWSKEPTVRGIAIIKPYNYNRLHDADAGEAIYRIDYLEGGDSGYDAQMEVSISGLPLEHPETDQYSMRTIRMFAGKTGDVVDVYGNSSHPNATFFSDDHMGFNWAFVASGDDVKNIGVAEVALPPNALDSDDRAVLLDDYSIRSVFTDEILSVWPNIEQYLIDAYLVNTTPPGYFDGDGFLNAGVSPGEAWAPLAERLLDLTPYNPLETTNLQVTFKQ